MKNFKYLIPLITSLILIGCGGSTIGVAPETVADTPAKASAPSATSTVRVTPVTPVTPVVPVTPIVPIVPAKTFSLSKLQSTTLGTVYSTNIVGSDFNGDDFTGAISFANRAQEMRGGVLVSPRDRVVGINEGYRPITPANRLQLSQAKARAVEHAISLGVIDLSIAAGEAQETFFNSPLYNATPYALAHGTSTTYVDTSNNIIAVVNQTSGVVCTPVSPNKIPSTVRIRDFGTLSTRVCDNGDTNEFTWRIEDAGNGNISVITTEKSKDRFSEVYAVSTESFTLDGSGDIIAYRHLGKDPDPYFRITYEAISDKTNTDSRISFEEIYNDDSRDTSGIDTDLVNFGKMFLSDLNSLRHLPLGASVTIDIDGLQLKGTIRTKIQSTLVPGNSFSTIEYGQQGEYMTAYFSGKSTLGDIYTEDGSYMYEHDGETGFILSIYEYKKLNDALHID